MPTSIRPQPFQTKTVTPSLTLRQQKLLTDLKAGEGLLSAQSDFLLSDLAIALQQINPTLKGKSIDAVINQIIQTNPSLTNRNSVVSLASIRNNMSRTEPSLKLKTIAAVDPFNKAPYFQSGAKVGSVFTKELSDIIDNPNVKSLQEAVDIISKSGYANGTKHPVQTRSPLKEWDRTKKTHNRYALLLNGFSRKDAAGGTDTKRFKTSLENAYDAQVRSIHAKNAHTVKKELKALAQKVKHDPNAEILIYYTGHGGVFFKQPIPTERNEHNGNGFMRLNGKSDLYEDQFKRMLQKYFPGKTVTLVLDSCKAGSYLA